VGVDEAGDDYGIAEIAHLGARMRLDDVLPPADGHDPSLVDSDRSVLNRSSGHGKEMFRRINDHSQSDYTRRTAATAAC
jgi:hypothetical protein